MKKCIIKKMVAMFLCVSFLFPLNTFIYASTDNLGYQEQTRDEILELIGKKSEILINGGNQSNNPLSRFSTSNNNELNDIEMKLRKHGITELTHDEFVGKNDPRARVTPLPSSSMGYDTRRWITHFNGQWYEIQEIYMYPKNSNSMLVNMGTRSVSDKLNYQAGVTNFVTTIGLGVVGPFVKGFTIYEALVNGVSGLQRNTLVSTNSSVIYSWSLHSTALFCYMKPMGQSDAHQRLIYAGYSAQGNISYSYPWFAYINNQPRSGIAQGSNSVTLHPTGDNSIAGALNAYTRNTYIYSPTGIFYLNGLNNRNVATINLYQPTQIGNIY